MNRAIPAFALFALLSLSFSALGGSLVVPNDPLRPESDGRVPVLLMEGIGTFRLPDEHATWKITSSAPGSHRIDVYHADGGHFGAVKIHAATPPVLRLDYEDLPALTPPQTALAADGSGQGCTTTNQGFNLCADIFYNGGGNPVWNQGSVSNMPSTYKCEHSFCLRVHACVETLTTDCSRYVNFWVYGTSTVGSACWTWGAWRWVNTWAVFDGKDASSAKVWVSSSTTC